MIFWAPVFQDPDGNELLIHGSAYRAETEEEAIMIRLGVMLVECIILHLTLAPGVRRFDSDNLPHREGHLDNRGGHMPIPVLIIAGPAFDA